MCNNKGFSLVELIIIVALIALLGTGSIYGLSLLTGQQVMDCANNTTLALDKAKDYAMTKSGSSDAYMEILKETDGTCKAVYYVPEKPHTVGAGTTYVEIERKTLGNKQVKVICNVQTSTGTGDYEITDTQHIRIYYDRNSGAMKSAETVTDNSGSVVVETATCKEIRIEGYRKYKITFFHATGRHTLERVF